MKLYLADTQFQPLRDTSTDILGIWPGGGITLYPLSDKKFKGIWEMTVEGARGAKGEVHRP